MRLRSWFLLIFVVLGLIVTLVQRFFPNANSTSPEPTDTTIQQYQEIAPLNVLVVQEDATTQTKRVLVCKQDCTTLQQPINIQNTPYTDGQSWYYYDQSQTLVRSDITGQNPQPIIAPSNLVKPRDIYVSPSGQKVAYFLDNIVDPTKNLTEIWAYDTQSKAVSVLDQNIHKPDMMTRLRYNATGDTLWYVANSGTDKAPKVELIVVQTDPVGAQAQFTSLNWQDLANIADKGVMDISSDATSLAYAQNQGDTDTLTVVRGDGVKQTASVAGHVVFLQWLTSGDLIYGLQDQTNFSFWQLSGSTATQITSHQGHLLSARSDADGKKVAIAATTSGSQIHLFTLDVASTLMPAQAEIPAFGQNIYVVQVTPNTPTVTPQATPTVTFPDTQAVAFIDANLPAITNVTGAKATRLEFTDQPNQVFVEYPDSQQNPTRILLLIRDVINPDWSILAHYQVAGTDWKKIDGFSTPDPNPTRIYEWEPTLTKWILKSDQNLTPS